MSANNQIKIFKDGEVWLIREVDADDGNPYSSFKNEVFLSLEEAIKAANDYMKENEVEYGLDIKV